MGAVVSCLRGLCETIGGVLMAIINGIGSIIMAIVNGIVSFFDIIISCITCRRGGGRKSRGTRSRV